MSNEKGMPKLRRLMLAAVILVTAGTQSSCKKEGEWWNEEWTMKKDITVDPAAAGATEAIAGTSVLVRLHEGNYTFASAKEDGTDIRFIADDNKTELPFFIEKYDALVNEAHVWVKPDLKAGGKSTFTLYYGNHGPKAVKADSDKAALDPDTMLAWHFSDKATAPGDASGHGNNGDVQPVPVELGLIGGGAGFTPATSVAVADSPTLQWTQGGAMTWSAWVRPGPAPTTGNLFSRGDLVNGLIVSAENGSPIVAVRNNNMLQKSNPGAPLAPGKWQHVAVTASGSQVQLYVDGELYASVGAALPALTGPCFIGAASGGATPAFVCEMDELQIAKVARSASWLKFAVASQGGSDKAAKVVATGPDVQGDAGWFAPGSTTAILLSSLTVDGWVVIGILAVMGVISWYVMYSKVRYINGIAKGNHAFMNVWKHVSRDLTVLDDMDDTKMKTLGGKVSAEGQKAMRQSSVYRIYHIGSEEIRHRLQADAKGFSEKGLSGRSIQAIKASMDGGQVRESQRLSKLIVLLTICISGGPFLGLLGTVIGVMITFAAIAAAGDVNVNSIAPGIAAALVATVAGLAVAIPSLFGYNYIQSRVKDANTDMHVFIDEFVTKMAEFYPDRRG
jgi:biopolymer transport protein ExbB